MVSYKHFMVLGLGIVLLAAVLYPWSRIEAGSTALDGKTFIVKSGFLGQEAGSEDELAFRSGKFYSATCTPWGFTGGEYTTRIEGDKTYFEALTASPKHGRISWAGEIEGDTITGNYVWTKERWYWKDARQEKWFRGVVKH